MGTTTFSYHRILVFWAMNPSASSMILSDKLIMYGFKSSPPEPIEQRLPVFEIVRCFESKI